MEDTQDNAAHSEHYITFKLDNELFAIGVTQVREVLDLTQITRVPTAPHYLRGVVNVRGVAIPVVDLRSKFGIGRAEDTVHTRILVMELELDGESTVGGGLADSVHNVVEIESDEIVEAVARQMRDLCIDVTDYELPQKEREGDREPAHAGGRNGGGSFR